MTVDEISLVERAGELIPLLRERGSEIDRLGTLPRDVLAAVDDAGLYRIALPVEHGGLAPVLIRERIEALVTVSRGNSSAAWTMMNNIPHVEMAPHYSEQAALEIWGTEHIGPLTGGSILNTAHAVGVAEPTQGGVLLHGSWSFCSNARMAAWMALGLATTDHEGNRRQGMAYVPRSDYRIADDWDVTGLRGSNSNSVFILEDERAFVPAHRIQWLDEPLDNPNILLHSAIILDFCAIVVGAALGAYDVFVEKAPRRAPWGQPYGAMIEMPAVQALVARADARISIGLRTLYAHADEADRVDELSYDQWSQILYECVHVAHEMRSVAEELRDVMGSSTAAAGDALGRYARDANCACLHGVLRRGWHEEERGRVLLGVQAPGPYSMSTSLGPPKVAQHRELKGNDV